MALLNIPLMSITLDTIHSFKGWSNSVALANIILILVTCDTSHF